MTFYYWILILFYMYNTVLLSKLSRKAAGPVALTSYLIYYNTKRFLDVY